MVPAGPCPLKGWVGSYEVTRVRCDEVSILGVISFGHTVEGESNTGGAEAAAAAAAAGGGVWCVCV